MQRTYLTRVDTALCWSVLLSSLRYLCTVSTFCKQASCLGDNAYQDSSSHTQLFYKELSTFYFLTVLRHVNCVWK